MFDLDQFIADCRAALAAERSPKLVRDVVARTVSDPASILKVLGEPKRATIEKLYHAPDLTILNLVWAPMMTFTPHDHRMWAVIGIYAGREDNIFWRRIPGDPNGRIAAFRREEIAAVNVDGARQARDGIGHRVDDVCSERFGIAHAERSCPRGFDGTPNRCSKDAMTPSAPCAGSSRRTRLSSGLSPHFSHSMRPAPVYEADSAEDQRWPRPILMRRPTSSTRR